MASEREKHVLVHGGVYVFNGGLAGWSEEVLVTDTRDLLLSAMSRSPRKLRAAGVASELHVFEGMTHTEYQASYPVLELRENLAEIATFFVCHFEPAG